MSIDTINSPHYPCRNCVYKNACGNTNRTMPCKGRLTKTEQKRQQKENTNGRRY